MVDLFSPWINVLKLKVTFVHSLNREKINLFEAFLHIITRDAKEFRGRSEWEAENA